MIPMKALRLALGELLGADADTLAPATDANQIALIMAVFTPSENLVVGDLTFADFTGSAPIAGATGAQLVGIDPSTLAQVIQIKPPVGGYRWETTDAVGLPQTIYGFALINDAGDALFAVQQFTTPITLQDAGQFVEIDPVTMTFVQAPIS